MHNITSLQQTNKDRRDWLKYTEIEKLETQFAEGPYIFQPAWDEPRPTLFSQVSRDVSYQKGQFLEQWTFDLDDPVTKEQAKIRVRYSDLFDDFMEFDVELNPIPIADHRSKDITVNFKMFGGFDPQGKYWTDANGLEMQENNIQYMPTNYTFLNTDEYPNYHTVSGNYAPVSLAIMMRDTNKTSLQVNIMNDRPQGGSADLTDKATIELMQQRRLIDDDDKGVPEFLNETERHDRLPTRVNARYFMQIFDTQKGQSKLRKQQIKMQQPLQYFFVSSDNYESVPEKKRTGVDKTT